MNTHFAIARIAAAAALVLSLAACDGAPLGLDTSELTGTWSSEPQRNTYSTPDGQRTLERVETWTFTANRQYVREAWLHDAAAAKVYVDYREEGTFTVPEEGVLAFKPALAFYRNSEQYLAAPEMHATMGETIRFSFSLSGGVLTANHVCPANALCALTDPVVLQRVRID